ncbi:ABC transporter substrate-binding protein [Streptomyces sp. NBC_01408]|uniref:ABC transporter substrate-binding protein n=1 Tax=Streptomyces sp. NBC_01408 TaxID=2903855 RepID=UPI0022545604|nr:ABC transporter substrate-binding protein [Streptomyces sp. NBC_01408]MCX4692770.1 ABC transporter substrate-binding protein [Streptomyces sp. NBC_01408]
MTDDSLTLVIDAFDDPATLDPHTAFDTASRHPLVNVYDGLMEISADRTIQPALAETLPVVRQHGSESWALIPVKSGIRFHDGAPLLLEDVVYSLRRMAITAVGPASLWSDALLGEPLSDLDAEAARAMAERIQATDDGVLLKLSRPYSPLSALLVEWSLVTRREWAAARGAWDGSLASIGHAPAAAGGALDTEANGTGPYALTEWDRAERVLRFQRNDGYWKDLARTPERVLLRSEDDRRTRESELLAGQCDFSVCQPESRDRLGQLGGIVLEKLPEEWSITPLGFINQNLDPKSPAVGSGEFGPDGIHPRAFSDVHLRRMLGHAFDHARYTEEVLDGEGLFHPVPFPAPALAGGGRPPADFDLELARKEWELAWDGEVARKGCRLVIHTHEANISRVRAAEILAAGLRQIDPKLTVEIEAMDFVTLVESLYAGLSPVTWSGWSADFPHAHTFSSALLDARAPLPHTLGLTDPKLAALLERARQAEPGAEEDVYREMADYCREQALFLSVPGKISYMTYADRWEGVRLKNEMGNILDFTSFRLRETAQPPARS